MVLSTRWARSAIASTCSCGASALKTITCRIMPVLVLQVELGQRDAVVAPEMRAGVDRAHKRAAGQRAAHGRPQNAIALAVNDAHPWCALRVGVVQEQLQRDQRVALGEAVEVDLWNVGAELGTRSRRRLLAGPARWHRRLSVERPYVLLAHLHAHHPGLHLERPPRGRDL